MFCYFRTVAFFFFYEKYAKNVFINFLRCVATLCVFILHTSIFSNRDGTLFNHITTSFLKLPAWGGVWMFFILGGYLAASGFVKEKYEVYGGRVKKYYLQKFKTIVVPSYCFAFLCIVLVYPNLIPKGFRSFVRFLLFPSSAGRSHVLLGGSFNLDGMGAMWYIFTVLPLYAITPFACMLLDKIKNKTKVLFALFFVLFVAGLSYRVFAEKMHFNWYNRIYIPPYANLDLYFCGVILAYVANTAKKSVPSFMKQISVFALLSFIMINTLTYDNFFIHTIFYPSVYIVLVCVCLYCFKDEDVKNSGKNLFEKAINYFSGISFGFYLFHSLILHTIAGSFTDSNIIILHLHMLVVAGFYSFIFAIAWKRIFSFTKI